MNEKEMVKQLVKLQILTIRWIERNTNLKCSTHRDMDRVLTANKLTCTYSQAVYNLKSNIKKYSNNSYLNEEIIKLEKAIMESNLKDLRFGVEPQKKFTKKEHELDTYKLQVTFFMINEMVGIKYIVENLGIAETTVKQACQQERLLNTKKIGKNWMVHIPECRAYWNIPDTCENNLYKDWIY